MAVRRLSRRTRERGHMHNNIRSKIVARIDQYRQEARRLEKTADIISFLRLAAVIAGIAAACLFGGNPQAVHGWALATIIVFGCLVKKHRKIKHVLRKTGCKIAINEQQLARMGDTWTEFSDDGKEFMAAEHPFINDLDIFGPKSLFQWINATKTFYGREILKNLLAMPAKDIDSIKARQDAVRELAGKEGFCQKLQCEGMLAPEGGRNPELLTEYARDVTRLFPAKWLKAGSFLLPGLTIPAIVLAVLGSDFSYQLLAVLIPLQILVSVAGYRRISSVLNRVHKFRKDIRLYEELLRIIQAEDFRGSELAELKRDLLNDNISALEGIRKLDGIIAAVDLRYNLISYSIFNFTLLWDYHCVFALEGWKEKYGVLLEKWLYTIGYFEALASLANIAKLNPQWAFPEFSEDRLSLSAKELGHPLLSQERRVCNDAEINTRISIITGSNMSGKTTWLRTIGINLVLAYAGAPVCANKLECPVVDIFTSMRINDDLGSGISTFYAELLRIKAIISHSRQQRPMLFLIDEIFRGTNSKDRLIGALSVLKNLNKEWVIGLISTHDLELCALEGDPDIKAANYHFTESYAEGEIRFDYKLRPGRCNSTNARYLMQLVGIDLV